MRNWGIIFLGIAISLLSACGKKGPEPLTLEQIPPAMAKAFTNAPMLVRATSDSVINQVRSNEYAGATIQLQALLSNSGLNDNQRDVSSAALQTLNQKLQEQVSAMQESAAPSATSAAQPAQPVQPEEAIKAAAALEHYKATK